MNQRRSTPVEEGVKRRQSASLGDTGDGHAGVLSDEQGISNRLGDHDVAAPTAGEDAIEVVNESDEDAGDEDEELEDEDEVTGADEENEDDDASEVSDPGAEPGKPI